MFLIFKPLSSGLVSIFTFWAEGFFCRTQKTAHRGRRVLWEATIKSLKKDEGKLQSLP